jgi:hypothetical protein
MCRSRSPAPICAAPSCSARSGRTSARARKKLAAIEISSATTRSSDVRCSVFTIGANASARGDSTNTVHPSPGIGALAERTSSPWRSRASAGAPSAAAALARTAATCGSALRSVFLRTRLMSGCAISVPVESTTYARPCSPILIFETTSQTNLRLTSTAVTPPPLPAGRAIVMYGSVPLRKYTGP